MIIVILVSGTIEISNTGTATAQNNRKNTIIKNGAPFTDCISEINNTDNAKAIDIVMPVYSLIEYWNSCSKTTGSLWQYYRDEPFLDVNSNILLLIIIIVLHLNLKQK